jgi:GTP-binding protein HflX
VHTEGEIASETHTGDGTLLRARVDPELAAELRAAAI